MWKWEKEEEEEKKQQKMEDKEQQHEEQRRRKEADVRQEKEVDEKEVVPSEIIITKSWNETEKKWEQRKSPRWSRRRG